MSTIKLSDLFPPVTDLMGGHSWAHQWSAARRKAHREKTKKYGDHGRQMARVMRGLAPLLMALAFAGVALAGPPGEMPPKRPKPAAGDWYIPVTAQYVNGHGFGFGVAYEDHKSGAIFSFQGIFTRDNGEPNSLAVDSIPGLRYCNPSVVIPAHEENHAGVAFTVLFPLRK